MNKCPIWWYYSLLIIGNPTREVYVVFLIYLLGLSSGFLLHKLLLAPRLKDIHTEADHWKSQWMSVKRENDVLRGPDE